MHFLKEAMLLLVNQNTDTRRELLDHFEEFGLLEPWLATVKIVLSMSEEVAGVSRQHAAEMLCLFVSSLPNLLHQNVYEGGRPPSPVFNRIQRNEKRSEEEEWRGEGVLQGAISSGSDDPALRVGDADTDDKECNPSPPGLFRNQTGSSVTSDLTSSSEYTGDTKKNLAYPANPIAGPAVLRRVKKYDTPTTCEGEEGLGLNKAKSEDNDSDDEESEQARLLSAWDEAAQYNGHNLLWTLVYRLVTDSQVEVLDIIGDVLRVLLDPDRLHSHKDNFLMVLYDCYMPWLIAPILHPSMLTSAYAKQRKGSAAILQSLQVILELLGIA